MKKDVIKKIAGLSDIKNEIISKHVLNLEETGIIAPYKNQVEVLNREDFIN